MKRDILFWFVLAWAAFLFALSLPGYIWSAPWSSTKLIGSFGMSASTVLTFVLFKVTRRGIKVEEAKKG